MVAHFDFAYKGVLYQYRPWEDIEPGENCKIFHDVYALKDGVEVNVGHMPLSPYAHPSQAEFAMWIKCGQPTREEMNKKLNTNGNASCKDVVKYYDMWLDNEIDKHLLGVDHE